MCLRLSLRHRDGAGAVRKRVVGLGPGVVALLALLVFAARPKNVGDRSVDDLGGAASACPPQPLLLLGDSLAFELRPYVRASAADCEVEFSARVKGGSGAPYWAPLAAEVIKAAQPAVVVVSLGGNDFFRAGVSSAERERVALAIDRVIAALPPSTWLVWVEPPAFTATQYQDTHGVRDMWREALQKRKRSAIVETMRDADRIPLGDKVHPTAAGLIHINDLIWATLARL